MQKHLGFFGFALAFILPTSTLGQTSPLSSFGRQVTVVGSCLRSVNPDRGGLTIKVDVLKADFATASRVMMEDYEKLRKAVLGLKLKDAEIRTSESTLQEEKQWDNGKETSRGFRGRMGLNVSTTEIGRLGEALALAGKLGIRQTNGLSIFVSPDKVKLEREACLEEAVKNARTKADSIAKSAGAKIGRALMIQELSPNSPAPVPGPGPMYMAKMSESSQQAPTIETGPEKLVVEVTATFSLE